MRNASEQHSVSSTTTLHLAPRTPPGGRWALKLYPWRYALLGGYVLVLAAVYCLFSIDEIIRLAMPWQLLVIGSVIFYGLQAAFLTGAPHWRWPRPTGRRPMWVSLAVGGVGAALLTLGLGGTLVSLFRLDQPVGHVMEAINKGVSTSPSDPWSLLVFLLAAWAGWLIFFSVVWAGRPLTFFRNIYRLLVAGSFLELLITIPVDVQVRKRTTCYCNEGTFLGLIIGITMAAWVFGPGLFLLFLTRRMERRRELAVCVGCGYDLRGLTEHRCPECGRAF